MEGISIDTYSVGFSSLGDTNIWSGLTASKMAPLFTPIPETITEIPFSFDDSNLSVVPSEDLNYNQGESLNNHSLAYYLHLAGNYESKVNTARTKFSSSTKMRNRTLLYCADPTVSTSAESIYATTSEASSNYSSKSASKCNNIHQASEAAYRESLSEILRICKYNGSSEPTINSDIEPVNTPSETINFSNDPKVSSLPINTNYSVAFENNFNCINKNTEQSSLKHQRVLEYLNDGINKQKYLNFDLRSPSITTNHSNKKFRLSSIDKSNSTTVGTSNSHSDSSCEHHDEYYHRGQAERRRIKSLSEFGAATILWGLNRKMSRKQIAWRLKNGGNREPKVADPEDWRNSRNNQKLLATGRMSRKYLSCSMEERLKLDAHLSDFANKIHSATTATNSFKGVSPAQFASMLLDETTSLYECAI